MTLSTQLDEQTLQEWIVERVARELGVSSDTIDPIRGLMNLGVDSLTLIGLAGELAELVDRDLPAEILWELNSIQAISQHIAKLVGAAPKTPTYSADPTSNLYFATARAWSPIRALQPKGARPPLFLVHGLAGGTSDCQPLIDHLGNDQPIFGLNQSPDPPQSIEEMAQVLVDGLRTVQRKGPYRLLGFCFGGVVAYEMGRQLAERGDEVALLGIFDPPSPAHFPRLRMPDALAWPAVVGAAFASAHSYLMWEAAKKPRKFIGRVWGRIARWNHRFRRRLRLTDQPISDYWVAEFWPGCQNTVRHNAAALIAYVPQRYPGRLTLFLTREQRLMHGAIAWRWRKLAAQDAEIIRLRGTHAEMLAERIVESIARQLKVRLDLANTARKPTS